MYNISVKDLVFFDISNIRVIRRKFVENGHRDIKMINLFFILILRNLIIFKLFSIISY